MVPYTRPSCWKSVPSSSWGNLKVDLCPSAGCRLSGTALCRRHVQSFPPKPLHFLERKAKFDLPDAGTVYTAACWFFPLPKGRTCPTVPAPRLSLNLCFMWTARTAPAAGNRAEGWHCLASPKREALDTPYFPALLCWWALALFKGAPVVPQEHQ